MAFAIMYLLFAAVNSPFDYPSLAVVWCCTGHWRHGAPKNNNGPIDGQGYAPRAREASLGLAIPSSTVGMVNPGFPNAKAAGSNLGSVDFLLLKTKNSVAQLSQQNWWAS